jgi:hypothetical protein
MIAQDLLFKNLIGNASQNINIRRVSDDTNFHDVAVDGGQQQQILWLLLLLSTVDLV